ncbi:unnamed protein product [Ambrosiozyma monospora]|uniref:Unnamed protein product n=1 Tax=Ambrosiozyma monospora TaxID=43982 RepID=A0A9W7DEQ4_AMBMO|nr:unnamed protein product [Ambrosiozyma monospora]
MTNKIQAQLVKKNGIHIQGEKVCVRAFISNYKKKVKNKTWSRPGSSSETSAGETGTSTEVPAPSCGAGATTTQL